jgi:hypothetical protein
MVIVTQVIIYQCVTANVTFDQKLPQVTQRYRGTVNNSRETYRPAVVIAGHNGGQAGRFPAKQASYVHRGGASSSEAAPTVWRRDSGGGEPAGRDRPGRLREAENPVRSSGWVRF